LIRPKESDEALLSRMTAEIQKDIEREAALDRDAEALLQKHLGQIDATQVNSRILFQKIKERLAKERTSSCEENVVRLTDSRISHLSHRLRNALQKGGFADFPTNRRRTARPRRSLIRMRRRRRRWTPSPGTGSRGFPQGAGGWEGVGDPLPEIFRGRDDPPEALKRSSRPPRLLQWAESIPFIQRNYFSPYPLTSHRGLLYDRC